MKTFSPALIVAFVVVASALASAKEAVTTTAISADEEPEALQPEDINPGLTMENRVEVDEPRGGMLGLQSTADAGSESGRVKRQSVSCFTWSNVRIWSNSACVYVCSRLRQNYAVWYTNGVCVCCS